MSESSSSFSTLSSIKQQHKEIKNSLDSVENSVRLSALLHIHSEDDVKHYQQILTHVTRYFTHNEVTMKWFKRQLRRKTSVWRYVMMIIVMVLQNHLSMFLLFEIFSNWMIRFNQIGFIEDTLDERGFSPFHDYKPLLVPQYCRRFIQCLKLRRGLQNYMNMNCHYKFFGCFRQWNRWKNLNQEAISSICSFRWTSPSRTITSFINTWRC